jgi:hypothetical protein
VAERIRGSIRRNFTARAPYVRRGGPVRKAADLAGKRIGMYSYSASGSIWSRHFLCFVDGTLGHAFTPSFLY